MTHVDFDAAFGDAADEPHTITLAGREWTLKRPSEVPAGLLLRMDALVLQLLEARRTGDVPDDYVLDEELSTENVARALAGDENVDAWLDGLVPYDRLALVVQRLVALYKGQDPGEAPARENRATKRAAAKKKASPSARSSSTGRR